MEEDCYKVEVVHFINPHLIWVKAPDLESTDAGTFVFEQIGIYGVLPQEMVMDIVDNSLKTRRSVDWVPPTHSLMSSVFEEAIEIRFFNVFTDERSSIFDDNTHKYGELIITKPNGKYRCLSKLLRKSGYAIFDQTLFHSELKSGNIKTKLSHKETKSVIKHLEKRPSHKEQVKKQASLYYTAQNIESTLTVENIEAHNRRAGKKTTNVEELLQRKVEDLLLCKEPDSTSVGRASHKTKDKKKDMIPIILNMTNNSHSLKEKEGDASQKTEADRWNALLKMKQKLKKESMEEKSPVVEKFIRQREKDFNTIMGLEASNDSKNDFDDSLVAKATSSMTSLQKLRKLRKSVDKMEKNGSEANEKVEAAKKIERTEKIVNGKGDWEEDAANIMTKNQDSIQNKAFNNTAELEHKMLDDENYCDVKRLVRKKKTKGSPKALTPECDITTQSKVCYGPPDTNFQNLPTKVVAKEEVFDVPARAEERVEKKRKEDVSNVEFDSGNDKIIDVGVGTAQNDSLEDNFNMYLSAHKNIQRSPNNESIKAVNTFLSPDSHANRNVIIKPDRETKNKILHFNTNKDCKNEQTDEHPDKISALKRKYRAQKESLLKRINSSATSDTSAKDSSLEEEKINKKSVIDSDDDISSDVSKIIEQKRNTAIPFDNTPTRTQPKNNVNPFKNFDPSISVFVDKLVTPVLMVHSKMDKRFLPVFLLRDVPFNSHILSALKNMGVEQPMMIQSVTWTAVLRGYSTVIVSPKGSGKTLGYLPAICRLISDQDVQISGQGPVSIIVCATSYSVCEIKRLARRFLTKNDKTSAFHPGMDDLEMTTSLLNGCDLLICTPKILCRLITNDLGFDLRRLSSFVVDDCERISEVYTDEIAFAYAHITKMLNNRVLKEAMVQFVLASRIWCDFMRSYTLKAPNPVVCIGAFQECVLYSKANTTASFVSKENKDKSVFEFLQTVDKSKRTVIVCRSDEEVAILGKKLLSAKYIVISCDSTMTVQDLYNIQQSWSEYQESFMGPILLCVDENLNHMNVTNAHYLVHYSLPNLFSMFCKRFSVLNDNFPSIFRKENEAIKIKILLEESNVEQLPKILHFIKRCTTNTPDVLDEISEKILIERDVIKAKKMVPVCDNMLSLGECPDFWNCQERHAVFKEHDEPEDWMPKDGTITFKILHYHTPVYYSACLLTHTVNGKTEKFPQNHKMITLKLSMYYSRESNRRLHGTPNVGDVCAVALNQNFFARCQVLKILNYDQRGNPKQVLIKLIDEEKLEKSRDINLYYLPDELKTVETYVVTVRLANVQPKDKDITFSDLARDQLKSITDNDEELYLRGQIGLTIGNCIMVETLEACRDLSSMQKTVVRYDFKEELHRHSIPNPNHLPKLQKLCEESGLLVKQSSEEKIKEVKTVKSLPKLQWAHLEKDDLSSVLFATAENPSTFFVRLAKFEDSYSILVKDIEKYIEQNPAPGTDIGKGDIILAKLPDDGFFERARIDEIIDGNKVKCFFVDHGDWRVVSKGDLLQITEKFITQLPFQAIECKLIGVKPAGDNWTEFATNWFTNCFEDSNGQLKLIYAQYFTKEKASHTGGHKYGVALIDTNSDKDIVINVLIMEMNLAQEEDTEIKYLSRIDFTQKAVADTTVTTENDEENDSGEDNWEKVSKMSSDKEGKPTGVSLLENQPIRSMPLVGSDEDSDFEGRWDMTEDFMAMIKPKHNARDSILSNLPAIKNAESSTSSTVSSKAQNLDSTQESSVSDMQVISSPKIKELDSDDFSSPESRVSSTAGKSSSISSKTNSPVIKSVVIKPSTLPEVKSNTDLLTEFPEICTNNKEGEVLRKPKLVWRQNAKAVTIKILLITEEYDLKIEERRLKFAAEANDTPYGFDFELYGLIDKKNSRHSNKGQYILVTLAKVLKRNWLSLAKRGLNQKWIVYDVDSIDVSSEEDEGTDKMSSEVIKNLIKNESDTEDEDFVDDVNFAYSR